jgi:integrase
MSITPYFDEKLGQQCFKVRITRKSSQKSGTRVDKILQGFKTKAEAEKAERKLTAEVQRELFLSEIKQDRWKYLIDEWYEAANQSDIFIRQISKKTIEEYYKLLLNYTSDWFHLRIDEIDKARVWLRLDEIDRKMSIKSRVKLRTAIDNIYKWCMLSGRAKITGTPTEGFKSNRKEEERLPEILTLDEIKLLLKLAYRSNHEWYPVWAIALYTGMRSGELFALRWSSVDFDNRMIYVHENWTNKTGIGPTKGRYWRSVPISDSVVTFLKELKIKTESTTFVLPRYTAWENGLQAEILRQFCIGVGLPSIKFHTLRSCFATQLIKDGVAPGVVMKMAGWKDLKTMQRYIRLAGIEVKGATNGLKLLPESEVIGRVVNLFEGPKITLT